MSGTKYWLVVGSPKNWETAFKYGNIWGLKDSARQKLLWEQIAEGDILIFYATSPVSGVIGYGVVKTKFKQDRPLWPKEVKENRVIWPLRFEFDVEYLIPQTDWVNGKVSREELKPIVRGGFQEISGELAETVIRAFQPGYKPAGGEDQRVKENDNEKKKEITHKEIQRLLVEIGKMQKFIAEAEYKMDGTRLDVVWRRVEKSVPTFVFEVQIGGDLYHALGKLKHAFDLWNSRIFLITTERHKAEAEALLSGMFHEIRGRIRIIDVTEIIELHGRKKKYKEFEERLGIW